MLLKRIAPISLALSFSATGCFIETHDHHEDPSISEGYENHHTAPSSPYSSTDIPDNYLLVADLCESDKYSVSLSPAVKERLCFQNQESRWETTCRGYECQSVPVYVQYMLSEDLGEGRTVTVEAFDNPYFTGAPHSTVTLNNFTANKAGQYQKATLYLGRGTYYARAYISKDQTNIVPYEYSDMQLVADRPLGVHGALSSPSTINLSSSYRQDDPEPIYITIDKLFKQPESELDHRAFLRLKLKASRNVEVERDRNIIIQLHSDADIQREPTYQFSVPSAALLVEGRKGETEFISDSLTSGRYYVFTFLDMNGNGYFDYDEPAQYYGQSGQLKPIEIKEKRTKYLALELSEQVDIELD